MIEFAIYGVLAAACGYVAAGLLAAVLLHVRGIVRIDPGTSGAGAFFRILITPGLIALWPVMLVKWRRALLGKEMAGPIDRPMSPRRQRALHGLAFKGLAVAVPVVSGLGLLTRPPLPESRASVAIHADMPAALPQVARELGTPFGSLPIDVRLRTDGNGRYQIDLTASARLEGPALMVFWSAGTEAKPTVNEAIYLGPIWGSASRRFDLPVNAASGAGTFILYAPARSEIVATFAETD